MVHRRLKNIKCDICGECFNTKIEIGQHINHKHENKKPKIKCNLCEKWLRGFSENLKKHILRKHKNTTTDTRKDFECNLCNKKFAEKGYLINHIRETHENEHNYCELCSKSFATPSNLKHHMKSLHQKSMIQCNLCEIWLKGFSTKQHMLRKHNNIEKDFECNFCNKRFIEKGYLRNHVREMHESKYDLQHCKLCDKSFTAPRYLNQHMKRCSKKK